MLTDLTWRKRRQERELAEFTSASSRYVDLGLEVRVVEADPAGQYLIPGRPALRVVHIHRCGGMYDRRRREIVGTSKRPHVLYASRAQLDIALHPDTEPLGSLIYGAESAGKTETLVLWHLFRWFEHLGDPVPRLGGQVAPTYQRISIFVSNFKARVPARWFRYYGAQRVIQFVDGARIQLVSTHRQSEAAGSPLQGFGFSWGAFDEAQDSIDVFDDMESRGRAARIRRVNGEDVTWFKQARTATAKDTPDWRTARDKLLASGLWAKRVLRAHESPFVPASFWAQKAATMSPREYRRRVLAEDVGPERQLYSTWTRGDGGRDGNVRMVPLGAKDVTAQVLRKCGHNIELLVGHDPGKLFDVSVFLKAYELPMSSVERQRRIDADVPLHDWFIVDEVTTEQQTTESHVEAVLTRARELWGVNRLDWRGAAADGPKMLVRADPHGNTSVSDSHPHRTVYTVWKQHGVRILAAAYKPGTTDAAQVPKEARLDMMVRLIQSASGDRRLYVACNDRGELAAPQFVQAVETMERDQLGRAEVNRKDRSDLSHWPAAVGYALWELERPRLRKAA